jgi:hypothetical protein
MLRSIVLSCLALVAVPPAAGQGAGAPQHSALERWSELPPERRAALRERFRAFQELDEVQRAELRARHERLREAERRVRAELEPEDAAAFEGLGPSERREFLRERLAHEFGRCGARVAGLLPDDVRARLESASPAERMHLMRALRGRHEAEQLGRGLEELGRRVGLSEAEIAAFADLPPQARKQKLFELRRREVDERVAREGPPAWIPADEWRAMQALDDREFCARLRSCRARSGGGDGPPELGRLLRPDPEWLAELEALPEGERRSEIERRLAARLLDWLERHPDAPLSADLERLRTLAPRELLESVRESGRGERRYRSRTPPREH